MSTARLYRLPAPAGPFGEISLPLLRRLREALAELEPSEPARAAPIRVDLHAVYTPSPFFGRDASAPWWFQVATDSGHLICAQFSSTVVDVVWRCSPPVPVPAALTSVA